jgi:hypothetical protein
VILRSLLAWTLGAAALAYTPTAPEILTKMEAALRRAAPVQAMVVREGPDGDVVEEAALAVPGKPGSTQNPQAVLDLPYALLTLPTQDLTKVFPTLTSKSTMVVLGRLDGKVCYILEGADERLWISKGELLPLKIEILSKNRLGTSYLYLDMVKLSEKVQYPSRTEVWRDDELVLVERLLPATASSDVP